MSFKTQKGFSFVEVVIVAALLGGLGLVFMNLNKQASTTTTKLQHDSDIILTTNEINSILANPAKCLSTFATTATPLSIASKYYISSDSHAPAVGYGNSGFKITKYSLTTNANEGILKIDYKNKSILKGSTGSDTISKTINLYVEGTPGAITKCRAISQTTTDIWTHGEGSNSHDIYYVDGKVGIGTTTPAAQLEVKGGIKPGSDGVLTGGSCAANGEGTFAYDISAHAPVYCNQSGKWATLGGTPEPVVAPEKIHGVNDGGAGFDDNCATGYSMTGVGVYGNVMRIRCTKFQ